METDIMQPLRYVIDLQSGLVQQPMRGQLMKGDKKANRVIVELTDGGDKAVLTGASATGSFIRPPDAAEIPLTGSVEGNSAIVVLDDACYAQEGYCEIAVKLTLGDVSRTVLSITGYVLGKGSGAYVDVSGAIPNIDDIIAQYAAMKEAVKQAQDAADAANEAASRAPYIGANSNWFVWNAATGKYVDSGVTAKGTKGDKGDPGTIENVTITSIAGLSEALNELLKKNTAQDTEISNKLGKTEQAADSQMLGGVAADQYALKTDIPEDMGGDADTLGGKAPEYYIQHRNLLHNSYFKNPLKQRNGESYTGSGYFVARWRTNFSGDTVEITSNGVKNTNKSGSAGWHFHQVHDKCEWMAGRFFTAGFYVNSYVGENWSVVISFRNSDDIETSSIGTPITERGLIVASAPAPEEIAYIRVGLYTVDGALDGDYVTVEWADFYEGEFSAENFPEHVQKDDAVELASCSRYFKEFKCPSDSYEITFNGYNTSDGKCVVFAVPFGMRSGGTPTVAFEGSITIRGVGGYLQSSSGGYSSVRMQAYGNAENEMGSVAIWKNDNTVFSGATANTPVQVNFRPGSRLTLSREL